MKTGSPRFVIAEEGALEDRGDGSVCIVDMHTNMRFYVHDPLNFIKSKEIAISLCQVLNLVVSDEERNDNA